MNRFFPVFYLLFILFLAGCQGGREAEGSTDRQIDAYIDYISEGGEFELPLSGATGYAAVFLPIYRTPAASINVTGFLNPGQGFTIIREEGDFWLIEISVPNSNAVQGWVNNNLCFINLPDIIPSIVYNNTNTYFSIFRSSGFDIPNITGAALYEGMDFNVRLGREEYIAPVLYGMAPKVFAAQQAALADGNTLILYEAFRPSDAHDFLHEHFSNLVEVNPLVLAGITADNFNIRWFLAEAPYNHQRGTAVDISLGRIDSWEMRTTGVYEYVYITGFTEYPMQTDIHELSVLAAIYDSSVHARMTTSWIGQPMSPRATPGTILMHRYCTDAGLIPLASEWWHFNDLILTAFAIEADITGQFFLSRTYSRPPAMVN